MTASIYEIACIGEILCKENSKERKIALITGGSRGIGAAEEICEQSRLRASSVYLRKSPTG
jgi:hypothetical protein